MQWTNERTDVLGNLPGASRPGRTPPGAERLAPDDSLFLLHVRLIDAVSSRYRGRGLADWELRMHAEQGLRDAAATYDPANAVLFSTHATWWIKQRLKEAILTAALRRGRAGVGQGAA